jgi:hypothetical protein
MHQLVDKHYTLTKMIFIHDSNFFSGYLHGQLWDLLLQTTMGAFGTAVAVAASAVAVLVKQICW